MSALLILLLAWVCIASTVQAYTHPPLRVLTQASLGQRIMVVAPHPDDESLGTAGLLADAVDEGKDVRVVMMTVGDGYRRIVRHEVPRPRQGDPPAFQVLGRIRSDETREAMRRLGVQPQDLAFLGYPETCLSGLWDSWDVSRLGVNGSDKVPYDFAFRPGAPYRGSSVVDDLRSVLASFSPDTVIFPSSRDENTDHWATNAFVQAALDGAGFTGTRLEYLVHRGLFPFPWSYLPANPLLPPRQLAADTEWLQYPLLPGTERRKHEAIEGYRSQRRVMEPYLGAFVRRNELFAASVPATAFPVSAVPESGPFPGVVARDASGMALNGLLAADARVTGVAVVRVGGQVWVGLQTRGALDRRTTYRLAVQSFSRGVTRYEVATEGGRTFRAVTDDATTPIAASGCVVGRDRVWVRVPDSVLRGSRALLVEGETRLGGVLVDRTGCRTVVLD